MPENSHENAWFWESHVSLLAHSEDCSRVSIGSVHAHAWLVRCLEDAPGQSYFGMLSLQLGFPALRNKIALWGMLRSKEVNGWLSAVQSWQLRLVRPVLWCS
jgi:hypothetical protein